MFNNGNNEFEMIFKIGSQLIHIADDLIEDINLDLDDSYIDRLHSLRDEISKYRNHLFNNWLKNTSVPYDEIKALEKIDKALLQKEMELGKKIIESQRGQTLFQTMEDIALPEPTPNVTTRNYLRWRRSPLKYSNKTLNKMKHLRLPQ